MAHKQGYAQIKMRRLAKSLEFSTTEEYYEYIINSKINGNTDQCCRLFRDMPKEYRKNFLSYLTDEVNRGGKGNVYYELLKLLIEEI